MAHEGMSAGKLYISVILKSKGFEARNRLHSRDFSVNILSMNAIELLEAIKIVENPNVMMEAFADENQGAATQMHREVSRLVHNYLCAVSTLTDHTRKFMNEHYKGDEFHSDYESQVQRRFNIDGSARFVKDLRNYVTHRGLPDSSIGMRFTAIGETAGAEQQGTGVPVDVSSNVTINVATLLTWSGWTSPAKRYLESLQTEEVSLRHIFEQHISSMRDFNEWFESRFEQHHKADLDELRALHDQYLELQEIEKASTT